MERKKRASKKICSIEITPHLAEYARKKYHASSADGSIRIPSTSDLYHCVWHHMQRPPSVPVPEASASGQSSPGILLISLPSRRPSSTDGPWKDPAYFNYLSSEAARSIEACLRREFNFEFHRAMMENEERGRPRRNIDVVDDFMRQYRLESITSDALLKNYYRYRDLVRPKQRRRYSQRKPRP
jgi:hypothetical protein